MKSGSRSKRKSQPDGDDLWTWAATRSTPVCEDEPEAPWYRGILKKINPQKEELKS